MRKSRRAPWTEERRLKVERAWTQRKLEETQEQIADTTAKEVRSAVCVYCGEKWNKEKHIKEHVPPKSVRRLLPANHTIKFRIVKICWGCKKLLKWDKSTTVKERRAALKEQLLLKFGHLLKWEDWPKENIHDLGPKLREHVEYLTRAKRELERRLAYKENE